MANAERKLPMTLSLARHLALAALALGLAAPAVAQDMPTVMPNDYVLSDILNRQRVDAAIGAAQPARPKARPSAPEPAATTYRASPQVSARVRRDFAGWMGEVAGTEGGRRIAEVLSRRDPVKSWAGIVASDGLRPGDVADAMAGYWILNWVMANGADSDRAEAQAVREQMRRMIAARPGFSRLGNAERQEMAEVLMLNFLIQHAAYTDAMARGDSATAARLGEAAVSRFQTEMGVDLRRLHLTNAGFVRG